MRTLRDWLLCVCFACWCVAGARVAAAQGGGVLVVPQPTQQAIQLAAQQAAQQSPPAPALADLWQRMYLGNTLHAWITAACVFLGLLLAFLVARPIGVRILRKVARRTETHADDMVLALVKDLRLWWAVCVAAFVASLALELPPRAEHSMRLLAVVVTGFQLLLSSRIIIDFVLEALLRANRQRDGTPDPTVKNSLSVVRFLLMLVLGSGVVLLALANMGVQVTPLLTGLGVGGIAVALAVQNILGDIFASLTIVLDKPFVVGDAVKVGELSGTVERVGIKTTRVRALTGEELIFSNADMLSSRIHNFKRMAERRVVFTVGVTYETPAEKLRGIPAEVRGIVERAGSGQHGQQSGGETAAVVSRPLGVRFDRCHFKSLGAYSLDFECVYFVLSPDYNAFMEVQHSVNLALIERFAQLGVEFAYPTQAQVQRDAAGTLMKASTIVAAMKPGGA